MGSSLGQGLAEQRESWQAAGGRRPRAKSTVLPASAVPRRAMPDEGPGRTILPPCHQPCGGMLWGWWQGRAGWGGPSLHPVHSEEVSLGRLGEQLLQHCRLIQAHALGQLLRPFPLVCAFRGRCVLLGEQMRGVVLLWCGADRAVTPGVGLPSYL